MPQWTDEQLNAMQVKNRRLLVSAAAGSGKTTVLAERIVRRITDPEDPVDVDSLLVMTFTRAAASEMRTRILGKIEDRLDRLEKSGPAYERLKKQAALVDGAKITTIDSFCLSVIRDHTALTDLDPSFRVGSQDELELLKGDVIEELLETCDEEADPEVQRFFASVSQGKTDHGIADLILSVYDFAQSTPWPDRWYEEQLAETDEKNLTEEAVLHSGWIRYLTAEMNRYAAGIIRRIDAALEICAEPDGPSGYTATLRRERALFSDLEQASGYPAVKQAILAFEPWQRIGTNPRSTDKSRAERVKAVRDLYKDQVKKELTAKFAFQDDGELLADMKNTAGTVRTLLLLAKRFGESYAEKKHERNLVDFNDLEHMALALLWERRPDGSLEKSAAAAEYSAAFREIYVDEYQDSNEVQEQLIRAIEHGEVFMVGDVKQSIYAFRQARPELFIEKYGTYERFVPSEKTDEKADGTAACAAGGIRIDLTRNFRSRPAVVDSVNGVFRKLMDGSLGGVDYDEDAFLRCGAAFPAYPDGVQNRTAGGTELLLTDTDEEPDDAETHETEVRMIAGRIRELTDPATGMLVMNETGDGYRSARYSDIVILLRAQQGWTETFVRVLTGEGIPCYAETATGYFDSLEIRTVLSILAVIDNPLQDIPLAALLCSPVIGMTKEELAVLVAADGAERKAGPQVRLYDRLCAAAEKDLPAGIREKAAAARSLIADYARKAEYLKLSDLIRAILSETGYGAYAAALPGGSIRRANLDMLLEKAEAYGETGYRGLYNFIRYIENLKKYDTDFGEAAPAGEHENTVRIMSIHKSKGLEFPVCFVAGLSKRFNVRDASAKILADPKLGIAADMIDPETRICGTTLKKNVAAWRTRSETLGEELRVLYVAMTRAREKLILTAACPDPQGRLQKADLKTGGTEEKIGASDLRAASNPLDWILAAVAGSAQDCGIGIRLVPAAELAGRQAARQLKAAEIRARLEALKNGAADAESRDRKQQQDQSRKHGQQEEQDPAGAAFPCLSYVYPHAEDVDLHAKLSVSELKRLGQTEENDGTASASFLPETPAAEANGKNGGAARGTVYHKIMEKLELKTVTDLQSFREFLSRLQADRVLTEEEAALVRAEDFTPFLGSALRKRMAAADAAGLLRRESQFVMMLPAREVYAGLRTEEPVLIQGVTDAWFEENGRIILVDYKTDRVRSEEELEERYGIQLDYYARALAMMKKKDVAERLIWSFALNRAISL